MDALVEFLDKNSDEEYYFGRISDKRANLIYFEDELSGLEQVRTIPNSANVLIYDERRPPSSRVYEVSISEVQYDRNGNNAARDVKE